MLIQRQEQRQMEIPIMGNPKYKKLPFPNN